MFSYYFGQPKKEETIQKGPKQPAILFDEGMEQSQIQPNASAEDNLEEWEVLSKEDKELDPIIRSLSTDNLAPLSTSTSSESALIFKEIDENQVKAVQLFEQVKKASGLNIRVKESLSNYYAETINFLLSKFQENIESKSDDEQHLLKDGLAKLLINEVKESSFSYPKKIEYLELYSKHAIFENRNLQLAKKGTRHVLKGTQHVMGLFGMQVSTNEWTEQFYSSSKILLLTAIKEMKAEAAKALSVSDPGPSQRKPI